MWLFHQSNQPAVLVKQKKICAPMQEPRSRVIRLEPDTDSCASHTYYIPSWGIQVVWRAVAILDYIKRVLQHPKQAELERELVAIAMRRWGLTPWKWMGCVIASIGLPVMLNSITLSLGRMTVCSP